LISNSPDVRGMNNDIIRGKEILLRGILVS
jgi:hypothetical protein